MSLRAAAIALLFAIPVTAAAQSMTPEQTVATLTRASHGLTPLSGSDVMTLYEKVRADCGPYLPALERRLDPGWIAADDSGERARQASNAAQVLGTCTGAAGRDALVNVFTRLNTSRDRMAQELRRRADALPRNNHPELVAKATQVNQIESVRGVVIDALAEANDARLRDALLTRFADENYALQLHALEYFKRATPRDAAVKAKLAPLLEKRDSGFYQSQKLRSVIE